MILLPNRRIALPLLILCIPLLLSACRSAADVVEASVIKAVKIEVTSPGVYRLSAQSLRELGLVSQALDYANLNLTQAGEEVPYLIRDDSLLFYGQASDSRYTPLRPYILRAGKAGTAMPASAAPPAEGPQWQTAEKTLHLEENRFYVSEAPSSDVAGPWFWQVVRSESETTFHLPAVGDGSGTLQINLYGATHNPAVENDHSLALLLNGQVVDELIWEGQTVYTSTTSLPAGALQAGENLLTLQNIPEDYLDFSNLNWIHLTYPAPLHAEDGRLAFRAAAGTATLGGFRQSPLLLDITRPGRPQEIPVQDAGDGYTFTVGEETQIVAADNDGFLTPDSLKPLREAGWRDETRQADLLILTTDALAPALAPLVEQRQAEGLTVAIVPIEELYDEFAYGENGPEAIRAFLRYTHQAWDEPAPRYVLLVGEATSDYYGFLANHPERPIAPPENIIPPFMVPVAVSGETVSDSRLTDLDHDMLPDLAIGRWPVDSLAAVEQLVERTIAYEGGSAPRRALFAADGTSRQFLTLTERLLQESQFPQEQIELLHGATSSQVAASWNEGAWLVTYTGHGSLELWGKEDLFSVDAVSELAPPVMAPPIVLQLTCLSGLFAHPELSSLSERLLTHKNGPVLLIGATSLTYTSDQEPFALALLNALQDRELERIGDVFQAAKTGLVILNRSGVREVIDTFTLFGDPSAHVLRPN